MMRYPFFAVLVSISLALLAGCGNLGSIAAQGQNDVIGDSSGEIAGEPDWEPTIFDTVNDIEGVTMAVKEGTVSPTGLTVTLENSSGGECIYGEYFWLEKEMGKKWYQVPVTFEGDYAFDDIGYILTAESPSEWSVNWEWLYGSLDAGRYRIVKNVLVSTDSGEYDTHYLAAEFVLQ